MFITVNIYGAKKTTVIRPTLQTVFASVRKGTSKEAIKRFVTFTVVTGLRAGKQMLMLDATGNMNYFWGSFCFIKFSQNVFSYLGILQLWVRKNSLRYKFVDQIIRPDNVSGKEVAMLV